MSLVEEQRRYAEAVEGQLVGVGVLLGDAQTLYPAQQRRPFLMQSLGLGAVLGDVAGYLLVVEGQQLFEGGIGEGDAVKAAVGDDDRVEIRVLYCPEGLLLFVPGEGGRVNGDYPRLGI